MAFCSFSKDCDNNSYVTIENKFITKYLPEADDFAVKVYLYGLYLCKRGDSDFGLKAMAEVLKCSEQRIIDAFAFWEDYDLVEVLSKSPFAVQYLPVSVAVGRPKKVHYEQYGDFNKELQRKMQKVGKFVSAGDYLKYMRFLEENTMQPQALLLVVEYCINKQGTAVSPSYVFNKAKKLLSGGATTYEQVERALSNYNAKESELQAVISALGAHHVLDETDYSLYRKWTETLGFAKESVLVAAKNIKHGSMNTLDVTLEELYEKGKMEEKEIAEYLAEREMLAALTFRIARKLGVKVSNPIAYIDEYVEKWYNYGFEESSLLDIALFCLKTERGNFDSMDAIVAKLFEKGIVDKESVKNLLKEKNEELKLFEKIRELCGNIRKNAANVSLIRTWRDWNFNDQMILEAAKRSATSSNPVPYINKILSEWKREGIFKINDIPEAQTGAGKAFVNPSIEAVNAKTDRERYFALRREKAQAEADKCIKKANQNTRFKEISSRLSKMELDLAKAEMFRPEILPSLLEEKTGLLQERKGILRNLGLSEEDLLPKFTCKKCSDTGFLKNGKACDCYQKDE
jgi:SOS response regulatory protein OraA/RecX